jgi:hypothetical protein
LPTPVSEKDTLSQWTSHDYNSILDIYKLNLILISVDDIVFYKNKILHDSALKQKYYIVDCTNSDLAYEACKQEVIGGIGQHTDEL